MAEAFFASVTFTMNLASPTLADLSSPDLASKNLSVEIVPADKEVLFVRQVEPKAITVDGKVDEAAWRFDQKLEKLVGGQRTGVEAAFDVVTDNDTLYIAVKAKDPKVAENPKELWNGDSVEVFLDLVNNRESTYNFDDRRFVISPTGEVNTTTGMRLPWLRQFVEYAEGDPVLPDSEPRRL